VAGGSFNAEPANIAAASKVFASQAASLQTAINAFMSGASLAEGHLLSAKNESDYANSLNKLDSWLGSLHKLVSDAGTALGKTAANYSGADAASSIKG
jgi:uncharacterized protein YukE